MTRTSVRMAAGTLIGALFLLAAVSAQKQPWPNAADDPGVTAVIGASWLSHLGLRIGNTNLGQSARRYGPSEERSGPSDAKTAGGTTKPLTLRQRIPMTGADLYRLNCQACHGAEGAGAPPEIHSVLTPVQGSSLTLVRKRLQTEEGSSSERRARTEADKARAAVLARMHQGGRRMPPRDYLRADDMDMLFAFLTQLAASPEAAKQSTRTISWARLGELTVKGTCHICHDATGAAPSGQAVMSGAIPSLASLMNTKRVTEFINKVRQGAVVSSGDPLLQHRGRMPVFYYLHDEDVGAAYMYLATYPPRAR